MGAALTTLFGRDFLVGYFLPGLAAVTFGSLLLILVPNSLVAPATMMEQIRSASTALASETKHADIAATLTYAGIALLVVAALIGLILSSANSTIFRMLEGYGAVNPLKLLLGLQRRRHTRAVDAIELIEAALKRAMDDEKPALTERYREALLRFEEAFPDDIRHVLPTRFGNAMRAFETYPRVMYGLEGIQGWPRLLAVIPKDYFAFVTAAKTQVDLCLNLVVVFWLLLAEYLFISVVAAGATLTDYPSPWIPVALLAASLLFMSSAKNAAVNWGSWVKSSFDVFQIDLRTKLGFDAFDTPDGERARWIGFSEAIVYRRPDRMTHRAVSQPQVNTSPLTRLLRWLSSTDGK